LLIILVIFFQRFIPLAAHTRVRTSNRTHPNSDIQILLFKRGSDQITSDPDIIKLDN